MTTKRATDAFPKSTLEDAILKAQKAGVDVTKVIKNSLQDALGKKSKKKIEGITGAETLLEEMNALINAAVTEEENVINNIDQIVNGLFEKLEKYPELFQRLLEDLKYDRLKSNLESAKVTTIPANLCELGSNLKPDFTTEDLKITVPQDVKNKITDDTPEKLAHFKDMGELEKIVKKFEPNPETDPVEPGVIAALDSIHYQDFPPKSGLLAGQSPEYFIQLFSRINTHIYYNSVPSKGDKAFYYFNGNKLDTLVVTQDDNIEYNLDRLLNKRNSGLSGVAKGVFYGLCQRKLQVLDEKLGTLKSNDSNYSSIEDIKKIIQKLYSRLPRIEDVGMKTEIKAKVDSALSICNRFSFKDNRMNYLKKSRNESSLPERDYVRWQDGDSKRQWCLQKCGDVDCGGGPEFLDFGIKKLLEETANFVASLDKDIDRHGGLNEKNSFYSESMKIIKNDIDKISNHILSLGSVAQELVDSSLRGDVENMKNILMEKRQIRLNYINEYFVLKDSHYYAPDKKKQLTEQYVSGDVSDKLRWLTQRHTEINDPVIVQFLIRHVLHEVIETNVNNSKDIDLLKQILNSEKSNEFGSMMKKLIENIIRVITKDVSTLPDDYQEQLGSLFKEQITRLLSVWNMADRKNKHVIEKSGVKDNVYYASSLSDLVSTLKDDKDIALRASFIENYQKDLAISYMKFQHIMAEANQQQDFATKLKALGDLQSGFETGINSLSTLRTHKMDDGHIVSIVQDVKLQEVETIQTMIDMMSEKVVPLGQVYGVPTAATLISKNNEDNVNFKTIQSYKSLADKWYEKISARKDQPEEDVLLLATVLETIKTSLSTLQEVVNNIHTQEQDLKVYYNTLLSRYSPIQENYDATYDLAGDPESIVTSQKQFRYQMNNFLRNCGETELNNNTWAKEQADGLVMDVTEKRGELDKKIIGVNDGLRIQCEKDVSRELGMEELVSLSPIMALFRTQKDELSKKVVEDHVSLVEQQKDLLAIKSEGGLKTLCDSLQNSLWNDKIIACETKESLETNIKYVIDEWLSRNTIVTVDKDVLWANALAFYNWRCKYLDAVQYIPTSQELVDKFFSANVDNNDIKQNLDVVGKANAENYITEQLALDVDREMKRKNYTVWESEITNQLFFSPEQLKKSVDEDQYSQNESRQSSLEERLKTAKIFFTKLLNACSLSHYEKIPGDRGEFNVILEEVQDAIKTDDAIDDVNKQSLLEKATEFVSTVKKYEEQFRKVSEDVQNRKGKEIDLARIKEFYSKILPPDLKPQFEEALQIEGNWPNNFNSNILKASIYHDVSTVDINAPWLNTIGNPGILLDGALSPEDIDGRETSKENKKVILWKEKIIHQAMSEMSDLKKYNDVGLRGIRLDDPHVMQGIEKNISNYLDEMLSLGSKVLLNGGRDFTTDKIQTYIENIESAGVLGNRLAKLSDVINNTNGVVMNQNHNNTSGWDGIIADYCANTDENKGSLVLLENEYASVNTKHKDMIENKNKYINSQVGNNSGVFIEVIESLEKIIPVIGNNATMLRDFSETGRLFKTKPSVDSKAKQIDKLMMGQSLGIGLMDWFDTQIRTFGTEVNEKKRQLSASVDDIKKEIKKYMTSESYLSTCFSDVVSRIRELGGDGLSLTSPLAMQADALDKIPAKSDHASYNQINLWYHGYKQAFQKFIDDANKLINDHGSENPKYVASRTLVDDLQKKLAILQKGTLTSFLPEGEEKKS